MTEHNRRAEDIGDVNSSARGSGARYITGKPDLSLIPIYIQNEMRTWSLSALEKVKGLASSVRNLARWQETQDRDYLIEALVDMGEWMDEAAHVLTYGTKKYAAWNWAKGMKWSACIGCAMRHVEKIANGEEIDDESGRHHAGHYVCNLIFLAHYTLYYPEGNDLPPLSLFEEPGGEPSSAPIVITDAMIAHVAEHGRN